MKKFFLIPMLGLLLACCTKEPVVNGGNTGDDPNAPAVTDYLTISLVAAGNVGSRANETGEELDSYEIGKDYENNVKMIRFYFFDADGKAAPAWKLNGNKQYESFIDWYPSAGSVKDPTEDDKNETVEKIVEDITLGINTIGNQRPAQILAVVNPSASLLSFTKPYKVSDTDVIGLSLSDLTGTEVTADYLTGLTNTTDGNFVMSNSVYVDEDSNFVNTVKLTAENFRSTGNATKDETNVVIYVERVVARLDIKLAFNDTDNPKTVLTDGDNKGKTIYKIGSYDVEGESAKKSIYILLNGWNVTTTAKESRLVKEINPEWKYDFFGNSMLWNVPAFHRSFWAINPSTMGYQYGTYNEKDKDGKEIPDNPNPATKYQFKDNAWASAYMQENAGDKVEITGDDGSTNTTYSTTQPTNVIIAAQLVDETGKPYDVAEWAYKKYTLDNLKSLFANSILGLYSQTTESNGAKKYTKITPDDLDFATENSLVAEDKNYYVYATLTEEARYTDKDAGTVRTWYTKKVLTNDDDTVHADPNDDNFEEVVDVDRYIYDRINHVMVWKNGLTYYYFDIQHLAFKDYPGYYGVVRNHVYQSTVTKIEGLGTPVYDPDSKVIYPEKTEYDESIITAEVKILEWRIVSQDYDLKW